MSWFLAMLRDKSEKLFSPQREYLWQSSLDISDKVPSSQGYGFSSGRVWMWESDYKESWALKNWCFWIVVLEKTLESPLHCTEIQPVHPKGNQSWIFSGRTDAEAETPILWSPDVKNWLTRPWCWERLKAGGEGDDRGLDGWMASLTPWTWVWVNSRSWWWTGRPGMLQSMGLQTAGHDWGTELNWYESLSVPGPFVEKGVLSPTKYPITHVEISWRCVYYSIPGLCNLLY